MTGTASNTILSVERQLPGRLLLRLSGAGREESEAPSISAVREALFGLPEVKSLAFDAAGLTGWNSRYVAFIRKCAELCRERRVEFQDAGLPEGVRRLLRLAEAVPEKKDVRHIAVKTPILQSLGEGVLKVYAGALSMFTFLGE